MIKILLLAANPKDNSLLQLSQEIREIDREVHYAKFGNQFRFEPKLAVRLRDLSHYLDEVQPDIVHFSGHGNTSSEIILEDEDGNSRPISKETVSEIFTLLRGRIRCVVLNACYSETQANMLAEIIDCVIGVRGTHDDKAAIEFAREFYKQLANGRNIETAFKLGRSQVPNGQAIARLLAFNVDPSQILFVKRKQRSRFVAFIIMPVILLSFSILILQSQFPISFSSISSKTHTTEPRTEQALVVAEIVSPSVWLTDGVAYREANPISSSPNPSVEQIIKMGDFVKVAAIPGASGVNLRDAARLDASIVDTLSFGTILQINEGPENGWWKVRSPFSLVDGWIAGVTSNGQHRILEQASLPKSPDLTIGDYAKILAVRGYQGINIRKSADTNSDVVTVLYAGTVVKIVEGPEGFWWQVQPLLNDQKGWIAVYSINGQLTLMEASSP